MHGANFFLDLAVVLIVAALVTSDFLYPVAVTVFALTTLLAPYLIKSSDRKTGTTSRRSGK
jgi:hypothetical protein